VCGFEGNTTQVFKKMHFVFLPIVLTQPLDDAFLWW